MFTVMRDGRGFAIKVRETGLGGFSSKARSIAEVQLALAHYYGDRHAGHNDDCPFCRDIAAKEKRNKRRKTPRD